MAVVTISREFGSEGNYIGTQVAEKLGYRFVFKKEINDVFSQYGIPTFEKIYHDSVDFLSRFDTAKLEFMALLTRVIRALAYQGNLVIMGRCSYAILQGLSDVVHVRIQAPLDLKVKRITQEQITAPENVERLVKAEDRNRAKLLQVFYDSDWEKATAFHMAFDTGIVSPDVAVTWIVDTVKRLDERQSYAEPTTKTLDVDPTLHQVICDLFTKGSTS